MSSTLYVPIPSRPPSEIETTESLSGELTPRDSRDYTYSSDDESEKYMPHRPTSPFRSQSLFTRRDPIFLTILFLAISSGLVLFFAFPFPTTIPIFISLVISITGWTCVAWSKIVLAFVTFPKQGSPARRTVTEMITLAVCTGLVVFWLALGFFPQTRDIPLLQMTTSEGTAEKYFIAANLYNNEQILPGWSNELIKLIDHLGPSNTFVSIYESNSVDSTPQLLHQLETKLSLLGIRHRIIVDQKPSGERWWPYNQAPERIAYLARARNRAIEPLQSADPGVRLSDWDSFTKVLFLNDVIWDWRSAVRLIGTNFQGEEGYDLACGMDFALSGLYDTWVSRDVCGIPMRIVWPYVKDSVSIEQLRNEQPFEVGSCWNGLVVFPTGPYLWRPQVSEFDEAINELEIEEQVASANPGDGVTARAGHMEKRGWKMIDNSSYPNSKSSPPLTIPLQFRTSDIEACDHSECFLFSYDLHRLYNTVERRARIYMNPTVRTAYTSRWWIWQNVVLEIPVVKWWLRHWSRGLPLLLVDWAWEFTRVRDYCTWGALANTMPDRCPALLGAVDRNWSH